MKVLGFDIYVYDTDTHAVTDEVDELAKLKKAIWAYYLLLIFEGALRKWFLPGLATPLLIVRDPIAMWLIYQGWKRNLFPSTIYLKGIVIMGLISVYLAVFVGHGNIFVAIYGVRILVLHYPLMFLMGRVLDRRDILAIGRATLYIALPMLILISMQFYSPQSAWVNRGVAGDTDGAGFAGSGDYKRPPGTFSFTNGTALFFGWLAPFVLYFWFNLKRINKWLLIGASVALLISIPFSISRTLFFEVTLTVVFAMMASVRKPENFSKVVMALVAGVIVLAIFSQTKYFTTATGAFFDRFDNANEQEGGLVKGVIGGRFFGGLFSSLAGSSNQPFWGYGIGMGTNVGSMLLTNTQTFLIAEGEWGRIIGEVGPLLGLSIIFLRLGLAFKLTLESYFKLAQNDFLPWLLVSFAFINIIVGSWAQPTALGFGIMIGGLLMASLKPEQEHPPVNEGVDEVIS